MTAASISPRCVATRPRLIMLCAVTSSTALVPFSEALITGKMEKLLTIVYGTHSRERRRLSRFAQKRVALAFFSNRGYRTVSRHHHGFVRQRQHFLVQ